MFEIKKTIRLMMKVKGCSFERLAEEFNKLTDAGYSESALRLKINNEKIKATELQVVCDILGYEFWMVNRETKQKRLVVPLKENMKYLFELRGMSQDAVRRAYVEKTGATIGQTGFSSKILKENMKVSELKVIADILDYDVIIVNPVTGLEFNEQGDKPVKIGGLSND